MASKCETDLLAKLSKEKKVCPDRNLPEHHANSRAQAMHRQEALAKRERLLAQRRSKEAPTVNQGAGMVLQINSAL